MKKIAPSLRQHRELILNFFWLKSLILQTLCKSLAALMGPLPAPMQSFEGDVRRHYVSSRRNGAFSPR